MLLLSAASTRCRFFVMPRNGSEKSPLKALANATISPRVLINSAEPKALDFSRLHDAGDYFRCYAVAGKKLGGAPVRKTSRGSFQ